MSSDALDDIFESQLRELAVISARAAAKDMALFCESPIEVSFGTAFLMLVLLTRREGALIWPAGHPSIPDRHFYLRPQTRIGNYRVDFVAGTSWGSAEAIIECDGREFHHSSRAQIERDRARDVELETKDYKVFRFPGTEIHHRAFHCAADVVGWLEEKAASE